MHNETAEAGAFATAGLGFAAGMVETVKAGGFYTVECVGPKAEHLDDYLALRALEEAAFEAGDEAESERLRARMKALEEVKWVDTIHNLVTTAGKNDALDKYLAGSAYTAAWYLGLISSTSYTTGPNVADTAASHSGWTESTVYSQSTRVAPSFGAASAGSKAASAAAFTINGTDTIKGCFLISNSAKSGTTGILYSAGLFSNGDKPVGSGDSLNVAYTATLT